MTAAGSIRGRYERLREDRESFLKRARDAAALTISHLLRPTEDHNTKRAELTQPYQSMGARGVNNLASKLLLSLFPVNQTFFRYVPPVSDLEQLETQERTEVEESLADNERAVVTEFETTNLRTRAFEVNRHLVATGNACWDLRRPQSRVFHLDSYVVQRDPRGSPTLIIMREAVSPVALSEKVRNAIGQRAIEQGKEAVELREGYVGVYTQIELLKDGRYHQTVEIGGMNVPGPSSVKWAQEDLPVLPLRFHVVDGEDYGRGHVEEYIGDLRTLEGLNQAIIEAGAAASKILGLVNPAGVTSAKKLAQARNGDLIPGRAEDVSFVQVNKHPDLAVTLNLMQRIERRLEFAFLLNSTRDAERVTAEEIRMVASELEDQLGGVFSLLATELQLPLVRILTKRLQEAGQVAKMPPSIRPAISTGLAAIGRHHEFQQLRLWLQSLLELGGERALAAMRFSDVGRRMGFALSVDTEGLIKTEEELQQEQQQAMLLELTKQLGPEGLRQAGPAIQDRLSQITSQLRQGAGTEAPAA